jgi:uncharacterized protein YuzE
MEKELTFYYDKTSDILYVNLTDPNPAQETEELGDDVMARLNPVTGEVENLEILFFSTRMLRDDILRLPISGNFHLMESHLSDG